MERKIVVGGCRNYNDYEAFKSHLDEIIKNKNDEITIISGHCSGVDLMGERYAEENGFKIAIFLPEWEKYGRAAGPIRNEKMVNAADLVIAFWDGKSKGTKSLIKYAEKQNKELVKVDIK